MIRTAADVNRMANLLAMKIEQRRSDIRKHTDYVRGKRGTLKFASDEFKRYMSDRFSGFADNWCLPVAQAPVERIHFRGFIPYGDVELDSHVMRVWERNDCDRKLQETALMMTATGRAFGLVTSMPDGRARISFEHPDSAAVHYDPLTGEVDAGLLVRYDEEHEFGTLLLPDVVFDVVRVRAGGDDVCRRASRDGCSCRTPPARTRSAASHWSNSATRCSWTTFPSATSSRSNPCRTPSTSAGHTP